VFSLKMLDSKAGRSLFLLLLLASIGFRYMRVKPISASFQNSYSSSIAAIRTLDGTGRISVRPNGAAEDLFQHFQTPSAAALTSLQPLNGNEWIALFHAPLVKGQKVAPLERQYQGWFESEEKETSATLPLVKSHRSLGGNRRMQDAGSGATLFSYESNAAYQPVAVVKSYESAYGTTWQVVFSTQSGMLSQSR
jgi:hypothetical protein